MSVARPINLPTPEEIQKRTPGVILPNGHWAVLEESRQTKDSWIHSCGEVIMGKELRLTVRDGVSILSSGGETIPETIPFCPKCEDEPVDGYVTPNGKVVIN